jgi:ATP-dependent RNA helicase RhlE
MPFSVLGLSASLLQALSDQQYTEVYPIQKEAIPVVLKGKDLLALAPTGSGKTAAFVLPILEMLQHRPALRNRYIWALVLAPTRELAVQIEEVFKTLAAKMAHRPKTLAVYGGVSINPQMIKMRGVEILVATPGRLLDLVSNNALQLGEVEILVLDEADKILNLGFKEELDRIFALLPKRRQNLLFSATLGDDVQVVMGKMLHEPVRVEIKPEEGMAPAAIAQLAYHVEPERKGPLLRYVIQRGEWQQVLVFVSAVRTADNVAEKLRKNGIEAMAFHSQKSQGARTEALRRFKAGMVRVLVATDLAARGIDIQGLPAVINYELPRSPQDYVHRIGRTGRADAEGQAISFICPEDIAHFKVIQKKMGKRVPMIWTNELDLHGF